MAYRLVQKRTRYAHTIPYVLCSGSHIRVSGAAARIMGVSESTWCRVYVDPDENMLKIELQSKPITDCRRLYVQLKPKNKKNGGVSYKAVTITFNANTNRLKYGYYSHIKDGEFKFTGMEQASLIEEQSNE